MDVAACHDSTGRAIEAVREGGGPVFLEFKTYRFRAHSMYDPDRYRDKAEIEHWKQRDPLTLAEAKLRAAGQIDDEILADLETAVAAEIDDAIAFAENSGLEPIEDLTRWVYSDSSTIPRGALR
jgi:pyruvate dehydrogenase E1 component alpha subunit